MIGAAGAIAFSMLATGVYVSQLHAKVSELHSTLTSLCARHAKKIEDKVCHPTACSA